MDASSAHMRAPCGERSLILSPAVAVSQEAQEEQERPVAGVIARGRRPMVPVVVLIFGSSMWVRISFHGGCALTR